MAMLICDSDTNTGDRGRQDLILQVHGDRCPEGRPKYQMASTPTFLCAVPTKLGHTSPTKMMKTRRKGTKRMVMDEAQIKGIEVASLAFTIICVLLAQTRRVLLNPALYPTCLPGVRDDGYSQVETDRLNLPPNRPRENTQRYQDAMACVVKYGMPSLFITVTCNPEWLKIKAALGPNDQACNRLELIARAFEAKLNRLCNDDRFGNKQRAGCL
ncbi:BQ5605_C011g06320 [Microbotryum silenes-dioicae]|uniref:BQ5605_C011g06305 protein n=1 Tax=Microbotryum silenes-dioicae TaxID=796604 RepID=A0A2X0LT75_9BASI|nr:BQ5605_C011g06305 [Microbotryum silenes-dioicae]SGY11918.1 BQ5605_C011g06320 [Microbotryum silenes-dioicae]